MPLPPERFALTPDDQHAIHALRQCRLLSGSTPKRFVFMAHTTLTLKQRWWLWRLVWHYRHQLSDELAQLAQRYVPQRTR